jgi:uncharacterized protein YjiS (DUF1127 family)
VFISPYAQMGVVDMPETISMNREALGTTWRPRDWLRNYTCRCLDFLPNAIERSRQRRALASLDDHMLKDIGITRSEACQEYATPFWR